MPVSKKILYILSSTVKLFLCIIFVTNVQGINVQTSQTTITNIASNSLKGTDIYNGLRGVSFNDNWKFIKGDVSDASDLACNDSDWEKVLLPHDWSIYNKIYRESKSGPGGGCMDGGIGWYRKRFTVPADYKNKDVNVIFDGIYMNSKVWINGKFLGERPYGYSSFEYDLSDYLNFGGENIIAVRVDNNQPTSRWYSGSGIYRNVWLTVLDKTHIDYCGMFVTTPEVDNESARVNVITSVSNNSPESRVVGLKATIRDALGQIVASGLSDKTTIATGETVNIGQDLIVSAPKLWSPDKPYLYSVCTDVQVNGKVIDSFTTTLGIRYFNFDPDNGFSLNGVNMKINGVCNHHDLGALGAAVNYRAIERQMEILKDMGCNALRTSHNPPDPQVLEVCDRLGFLVMDEAFDVWETGKNNLNDYHLYFTEWAQRDLQDFVIRDRNHPSVIMWSIGNEIQRPIVETAVKLRDWVKQCDTTRPVTWASNHMGGQAEQEIAGLLDLAGYNYFPEFYDAQHKQYPKWKMIASETCSAVRSRGVYFMPSDQKVLRGDNSQCSSYDNGSDKGASDARTSYTNVNSRDFIAGEFIWTGFDYIGEPWPYEWVAKSSYFGIIDTCGFPKDIYYFYQSKWSNKPMVHILPHWNWKEGENVDVWAYTNCDTVELFLNGVSLGAKTVSDSLNLVWNVGWEPGILRAKAVKGDTVIYDEVVTAGQSEKILLKPDRAKIVADGKDLVFIEVDITDSAGVVVPGASNLVNFSVIGPGEIVGVDNGNPISMEPYKANSRKAFSGKCLVIVQTDNTPGQIVVSAKSDGLIAASFTLTSVQRKE